MKFYDSIGPNPRMVRIAMAEQGVNVETIRYYQRLGLIETPERPQGGQRGYPPATVERLQFIRRAQQLGFTLDEIADLLKLESGADRASVQRIAGARLVQIRARIEDLTKIELALSKLLDTCVHTSGKHACPIIEAIAVPDQTIIAPKPRSRT